ncbi:MAG: VWA domain-containing protein [Candidatus Methanofastidiosia archaeon]|jgi:Mg-chelatase subunit ChlD
MARKKSLLRKKLMLSFLAFVIFGSFVFGPTVNPTEARRNTNENVLQVIQEDYETGSITFDEAMLYKAYALFEPEKLPEKYYSITVKGLKIRGIAPPPEAFIKSGTPVILEIKDNWDSLSRNTKDAIGKYIFCRPDDATGCNGDDANVLPSDADTYDSSGGHFKIHYVTTGNNAVDTTDSNTNGTPDYIEEMALYYDHVWDTEVTSYSYDSPASDISASNNGGDARYDIYVFDLGDSYGYTCPEQSSTPSYSFIAMNNSYDEFPQNDDPDGNAEGAMKVTAAHEFFHAVQFVYDLYEERWWMETTSTWMEDEVYDQVNDNYNYMANWFSNPDASLTLNNGNHEYGNFIFARYLSEIFNNSDRIIIRHIWEEMRTTDGLAAIDNVLSSKYGSNLKEVFKDFTVPNYFKTDYEEGSNYPNIAVEKHVDLNTGDITLDSSNIDNRMDSWATDYITITLKTNKHAVIEFEALDPLTDFELKVVTEGTSRTEIESDPNKGQNEILVRWGTYTRVVLIVMNTNTTSHSAFNNQYRVKISTGTLVDSILVMDRSGSMSSDWNGEKKLDTAKAAETDFIDFLSTDIKNHKVGLVSYASDVLPGTVHPTDDWTLLKNTVNAYTEDGLTNIGAALDEALDELETDGRAGAFQTIVFFTDGHVTVGDSEAWIIAHQVQEAKGKSIKIFSLGFGEPSYLHDDFLQEMADETGGTYAYVDDYSALIAAFQSATQKLVGEKTITYTGHVNSGETVTAAFFNVESLMERITMILNWQGSDLDFEIIDPHGHTVVSTNPYVIWDNSAKPEILIINYPEPGKYTIKVKAVDVPLGGEDFSVVVSTKEKEKIIAQVDTNKSLYEIGETAKIIVTARNYNNDPVIGATVTVIQKKPDNSMEIIPVSDNGDGTYTGEYRTEHMGKHSIETIVTKLAHEGSIVSTVFKVGQQQIVDNAALINEQMRPMAQYNILKAKELLKKAESLCSELESREDPLYEECCSDKLDAAIEFLEKAEMYFTYGNYIAANNYALKAVKILEEILVCCEI